MNVDQQKTILEYAYILEDQLFYLHNVQVSTEQINIYHQIIQREKELGDIFLSQDALLDCATQLADQLYKIDVRDDDMIGVVTRALCSCMTLRDNIFSQSNPFHKSTIHTTQEVDVAICELLASWTSVSVQDLIRLVQRLSHFLSSYGGLMILPDGVTSISLSCFWCRFERSLENEIKSEICTHYVVEKPHHATKPRETDIEEDESREIIQDEEDRLSLYSRIGIRQKKRQLKEIQNYIQQIHKQYSLYSSQKKFITSIKQISPFLYSITGKMLIFLRNRIKSMVTFSPTLGCKTIKDTLKDLSGVDLSSCRDRLISCLKRVSLSPTNMKIIHEKFEYLYLDPLSIQCGEYSMLRTSIVAKKTLLALHQSPEKIVNDCKVRCKAIPEKILEDKPESHLDQMFAVVVIVTAYNAWLSSQMVNPSLHISLVRGDIGGEKNMGLTLLYDYRQIGFQLDRETKVFGVYDDIPDLCVLHLVWLHKKKLCSQSHLINNMVS